MPMCDVSIDGTMGIIGPVDIPRTAINVGAFAAVLICVAACLLHTAAGQWMSIAYAYTGLAAIELCWLIGQAALITLRD